MKALLALIALLVVLGLGFLLYSSPTTSPGMTDVEIAQIEGDTAVTLQEKRNDSIKSWGLVALAFLPRLDRRDDDIGIYFRSVTGKRAALAGAFAMFALEGRSRAERLDATGTALDGGWKLVLQGVRPQGEGSGLWAVSSREWELYDLSKDKTEINNLADKHPKKLEELKAKFEAWWAGVEPGIVHAE